MKLFLDTADTDLIEKHFQTDLIDGITTNPTLIMKSGRDPEDVYQQLIDMGIDDISMEVVSVLLVIEPWVKLGTTGTAIAVLAFARTNTPTIRTRYFFICHYSTNLLDGQLIDELASRHSTSSTRC